MNNCTRLQLTTAKEEEKEEIDDALKLLVTLPVRECIYVCEWLVLGNTNRVVPLYECE